MLPVFIDTNIESPYNPVQGDNTPHCSVWDCLNPDLQVLGIHPQKEDRKPSIKSLLDSEIIYHEDASIPGRETKVIHLEEMKSSRLEKYIIWQINHFRATAGYWVEFTDIVSLFESVNGLEYYLLKSLMDYFEAEGLLDVKLAPSINPRRSKKLYAPSKRLPKKPRASAFGYRVPAFYNAAWERPTYAWIERVCKAVGLDPTPLLVDLFYYLVSVAEWTNAGLVPLNTYCRSQEQISIALGYPTTTVCNLCNKLKKAGLVDFTNKTSKSGQAFYAYGIDTSVFRIEEPPAIITDMPFSLNKEEIAVYRLTYFDKESPDKHYMRGEKYNADVEAKLKEILKRGFNASYILARVNSGKH